MHLKIFKQSKQIIESNALRKSKKLKNILVSCQNYRRGPEAEKAFCAHHFRMQSAHTGEHRRPRRS